MFLQEVFHLLEFQHDPEFIDEREKKLKEGRITEGTKRSFINTFIARSSLFAPGYKGI